VDLLKRTWRKGSEHARQYEAKPADARDQPTDRGKAKPLKEGCGVQVGGQTSCERADDAQPT